MIDIGRIVDIQDRIREIQQQIGSFQQMPGAGFDAMLKKEIERTKKGADQTSGIDARTGASLVGGAATAQQAASTNAAAIGAVGGAGNAAATPAAYSGYWKSDAGSAATSSGGAELDRLIASAAAKYDLDPKLVSAIAEAESGGDQSEISSAGAVGVMQLMPGTAASLGVDPYDIEENVEGGAKYLRQMLDTFGGDLNKAVAAYNAGPNAVKRYGGIPPYSETQNYVSRVLDLYK